MLLTKGQNQMQRTYFAQDFFHLPRELTRNLLARLDTKAIPGSRVAVMSAVFPHWLAGSDRGCELFKVPNITVVQAFKGLTQLVPLMVGRGAKIELVVSGIWQYPIDESAGPATPSAFVNELEGIVLNEYPTCSLEVPIPDKKGSAGVLNYPSFESATAHHTMTIIHCTDDHEAHGMIFQIGYCQQDGDGNCLPLQGQLVV